MVARDKWGMWEKWINGVKRYKLPVIKQVSLEDIMYSMATVVNNIVFAYLKAAEKVNLKNPHHKENNCNHVW